MQPERHQLFSGQRIKERHLSPAPTIRRLRYRGRRSSGCWAPAAELAGSRASTDLLMELGEALVDSGDGDEAGATYRRVLDMPSLSPETRVRARRMLGRALLISGDLVRAQLQFRDAAQAAVGTDMGQAVEALLDQAFVYEPARGPALALPLIEKARALASQATPALQMHVQTAWAFATFVRGDPGGMPVVEAAMSQFSSVRGRSAWTVPIVGGAQSFYQAIK